MDYHTSQKIRIFLILLEVVITILEMDQKEQVYRKDWDLLIILDACRYDYFKKYAYRFFEKRFNCKLFKAISPASHTYEWARKVLQPMTLPALKCGVSRPEGRATPYGGCAVPATWSPNRDHDTFHHSFINIYFEHFNTYFLRSWPLKPLF